MLPNQSHAPTRADLEDLDTSVKFAEINLRGHMLVNCHSHRLRKIAGHLDMLREVAQELRREIAEHLAGVPEVIPMLPCYADPLDAGLLYGSPEPWDEHPEAVGSCDLAIPAGNWAPCDGRRGA